MTEKIFNITIEIRNGQAIISTEEIVKRKKSFFQAIGEIQMKKI